MLSIAGAVATCALMLTMILQHLLRVARRADGSDQSADAFLGLAQCEKWAEVYEMIDHGQAGVDDYNRGGVTALHLAAHHGTVAAIDELVQRGANIDAKTSHGVTALHYEAYHDRVGAAQCLVHHGADFNGKSEDGNSPIDEARYYGHPELAAWLATVRARRHWAGARALARPRTGAFACASFWHAHVGERLCAPGGTWAERDRAAFEEAFQ